MNGKCCCIVIGLIAGCVIALVIPIVVYSLQFGKVFHKGMIDYQVTNASLTKFNLTDNSTLLDYNLKLNLTLENPSAVDYYFTRLDAVPVFKSQNLNDMTSVSKPFYLQHQTNVTFPALFSGNRSVPLGAQEASDLEKAGVFDIDLKINSEFSFHHKNKKISMEEEVTCDLIKVPLNFNGTNGGENFQITKCEVTKLGKIDISKN